MNLNPAKSEFDSFEHAEIRRQIEEIKLLDGLTQAEIGRQAEVPQSTLSSYLKGSYGGDNNVPAGALFKWLSGRQRIAAQGLRLPIAPSFQPLYTSDKILALFDMAREMRAGLENLDGVISGVSA